jgi:ATP-dependent Lon protease
MSKHIYLSRMTKKDKKNSKKSNSLKRVKKRVPPILNDNDDSSIDSKGNIRDLIDYDYNDNCSDSDSDYTTLTTLSKPSQRPPKRKAAIVANKKINNIIIKEKESKIKQNITPIKRKYPFKNKNLLIGNKKIKTISKNKMEIDTEDESEENESDDYESESEEYETELEESEEDDNDLEDDEEYETEEDEIEDDEDNKNSNKNFGGIILALGGNSMSNSMKPKKYNMKKEPESVKKFVKLLTLPVEENTIDKQIEQFKELNEEKQKEIILALENRPTSNDSGINLMLKIITLKLPSDVQSMVLSKYNSLQNLDPSSNEYFKLRAWLDKLVSIPFGVYKDIPVRLEDGNEKCAEFMNKSKKCLDDAVYGQEESKLQIMQFISTKIANPESRGLSLLLVGPPGIGKTSIIKNGIAKALNWPFQFISLGGDSDASTYTGHQLVYESSHCGKIVNSLIASKSMSTVLMFDEIDKISQTPKGEEVMNLLIHLTDPVQNGDFEDKYLSGIPIDLSKVMFIFSANDINKIDKVLLDRMMVIDLKGYDVKQKTTIAEQYLLPLALKEVNLNEKVSISKDILTTIIQEYANDEKGVRELKRCIEQITQKINMLRMFNSPDLPFHIKDFSLPFIVKKEHIKLFLKKKENINAPPPGMYI